MDNEKTVAPDKTAPLTFAQVVTRLNSGGAVGDIQEKIKEATAAVRNTGKNATVTIKLTIGKGSKTNPNLISIMEKISATIPTCEHDPALLYADETGNLVLADPDQMSMQFARGGQ